MAKKNTSVAKREAKGMVTVESPFMIVEKVDGKETFKGFTAEFSKTVVDTATDIAGALRLVQSKHEKVQIAINVTLAYNKYKELGGKGLPHFVHTYLDKDCPDTYG